MAMTLSFHENIDYAETGQNFEIVPSASNYSSAPDEKIHLFTEKMRVPKFNKLISRERLAELLDKSSGQFGTTLISGRAGTGKTALAADYAKKYKRVAWFSVEAADCDWKVFSQYFVESFSQSGIEVDKLALENLGGEIYPFVEFLFEQLQKASDTDSLLIVLDDIHYVFDSGWFTDFFYALLYSLPKNINLLLLSRTKPPLPLWRLRSKQVLGAIDEKILAFTGEETTKLFKSLGLSEKIAHRAFKESYGRISKLKQFAETIDDC